MGGSGQVRTAGRLSLPVTITEEELFTGDVTTLDITGPKRIPQSDPTLFQSTWYQCQRQQKEIKMDTYTLLLDVKLD